jgi:Ca-activated chloride channel family protein
MKKPNLSTLLTLLGLPLLSAGVIHASPSVPAANAPLKLSVMTDRPLLHRAAGPQEVVVRIELAGLPCDRRARQPLNLAVVLDRSGSMSGAKIEQARQAAEMLVDRLGPDDIFSLVIYDTEVEVLVPPRKMGRDTESIRRQIRQIQPGGSTALYHGVETGGQQLAEFFDDARINRVLLLSDGIANAGPSSNREIADLGQRLAREGRSVTTIGLGADYNEDLMTALAEASDANFHHVADVEALPDVFQRELGELESIIARRLTVEITFPDGVEPLEFLGRSETLSDQKGRITFGTLAADQHREIYVACRVDPSRLPASAVAIATASLFYHEADGSAERRAEGEATVKSVDDETLAGQARVAEITAQAEIHRNVAATRRTIALADEGRSSEARAAIASQITRLRSAQAAAPAPAAAAIAREVEILEKGADNFGDQGLSKEGRKALQWNNFQRSNSKSLDPEAVPKK